MEAKLAVRASRPSGVSLIALYEVLCCVGVTAGIPYEATFLGETLPRFGWADAQSTVVSSLWVSQVLVVTVILGLVGGLIYGKEWARVTMRTLSVALAISFIVFELSLIFLFLVPNAALAATISLRGGITAPAYGLLSLATLYAVVAPMVIHVYLGGSHVRAYYLKNQGWGSVRRG
jgi:hypothetical protein